MRRLVSILLVVCGFLFISCSVLAQTNLPSKRVTPTEVSLDEEVTEVEESTISAEMVETQTPTPIPITDITEKSQEAAEPLKKILDEQVLGSIFPSNPIKYAIRNAVNAGVPINTLVLLLLLPAITTIIAAARHVVGIRGFGIFLPAALSVAFVAVGPVFGILLFLVIVVCSIVTRLILKKFKLKLQYLPRMALILLFVVMGVLGVLFLAPLTQRPDFANVSIFPVLILVLLAEDFTKVQLGKNMRLAIKITSETLMLALISYAFMIFLPVRVFVLLHPEIYLLLILVIDVLMGRYIGLRLVEYWRFRKLITG